MIWDDVRMTQEWPIRSEMSGHVEFAMFKHPVSYSLIGQPFEPIPPKGET
jgi:hypothetical protein